MGWDSAHNKGKWDLYPGSGLGGGLGVRVGVVLKRWTPPPPKVALEQRLEGGEGSSK